MLYEYALGSIRITRLIFIADNLPQLRVNSLKMALKEVVKTLDVKLYHFLYQKLEDATNGSREMKLDQAWLDKADALARTTTDSLEIELKNYKSNFIEESIRVGTTRHIH